MQPLSLDPHWRRRSTQRRWAVLGDTEWSPSAPVCSSCPLLHLGLGSSSLSFRHHYTLISWLPLKFISLSRETYLSEALWPQS